VITIGYVIPPPSPPPLLLGLPSKQTDSVGLAHFIYTPVQEFQACNGSLTAVHVFTIGRCDCCDNALQWISLWYLWFQQSRLWESGILSLCSLLKAPGPHSLWQGVPSSPLLLKGGPCYIHGCSPKWCSDAILGHQALALSSGALPGHSGVALLASSSITPGL
jgi:hypothetical protein